MEKKKIIKFFLLWIGMTFIDLIILLFLLNMILVPTYIQENNLINPEMKDYILYEIKQIAFNISSSHEYIRYKYDCKDFSRDLWNELEKNGIKSTCVWGLYNKTNSHVWVEVNIDGEIYPIEATSGFLIENETYSKNYRILKKGFCYKK